MKTKKNKYHLLRPLGYLLLGRIVAGLCKTLRVNIVNSKQVDEYIARKEKFILAFWHGTMLYPWYHHKNNTMLALISQSKDGELLARTLKYWNYKVVRGSSSKGGDVALGIMVDFAKFEGSVCLTPDGPRGPERAFKAGAVVAAKKSGVPLVLLGVAYQKKSMLKSWDKFQIPQPFSKVQLMYSDPIVIDKNTDRNIVSATIEECEKQLNLLQEKAAEFKT